MDWLLRAGLQHFGTENEGTRRETFTTIVGTYPGSKVIENKSNMLSGYKTYLLAVAAIAYGLYGVFQGWMTGDQAIQVIWSGLTAAGLRAGIAANKPQ